VRLAREGGVDLDGTRPEPTRPSWDEPGIHGRHRSRQWDAVTTLEAPDLPGDRVEFVALSPDEIVVDAGDTNVDLLAEAVERSIEPPYRAEAVRRDGELWAVAARRIEIVRLPDATGEQIELSSHEGERRLLIDGEPAFGSIPALERAEHVVRARRIDGDAWEVETAAL
jgi:hypothetical protein